MRVEGQKEGRNEQGIACQGSGNKDEDEGGIAKEAPVGCEKVSGELQNERNEAQ